MDDPALYEISPLYGFVPEKSSQTLGLAFREWEALAANLPHLLEQGSLQESLCGLPDFDVSKLTNTGDWQRAYVILGFLTHAWVHGCRQSIVPAILAEPFLQVCDHIGLKPVLSYAGLCLYNWIEDSGENSLLGHKAVVTFTGTFDEAVFYLVPVLVEKEGGALVVNFLEAQRAAADGDWERVPSLLADSVGRLETMTKSLEELRACNPNVFYHQVRPFIAGLQVKFERRPGEYFQVDLAGGSAAQSSLFQFLDRMLDVNHTSTLPADMRIYMPRGHRRVLNIVDKLVTIGEMLDGSSICSMISSQMQKCLSQLRMWRSKHIAIVTRYIVLPAQTAARAQNETKEIIGTAGSSPVAFLKQMRDETSNTIKV